MDPKDKEIADLAAAKAALETENASLKAAAAKPTPDTAKVAEFAAAIQAAGYVVKDGKLAKPDPSPDEQRIAAYELEIKKSADKLHGQTVALFLQQQAEAGRVIPRFQPQLAALLNATTDATPIKYQAKGADGKPAEKEAAGLHSLVKSFVEALPELVKYAETAPAEQVEGEAPKVAKFEGASKESYELDCAIRAHKAKHQGMSYSAARLEVIAEKAGR